MNRKALAIKVFFRLALSVVLFLGALEVGMRVIGRGILATQELHNEIRPEDTNATRIVALGDSGTADDPGNPSREAWPRQLERKLLESGSKVRVYNLGRISASTAMVMERLPEQLDHFHPHIVISMVGGHDQDATMTSAWIEGLRVVKLYRFLFRGIAELRLGEELDRMSPRDFGDAKVTRKILAQFQTNDLRSALEQILQQASQMNASDRSRYFLFLANKIEQPNTGIDRLTEFKMDLLQRSLAAQFQPRAAFELARVYERLPKGEESLALAKEIVGHGWVASDWALAPFLRIAANVCQRNGPGKTEWPGLLKRLSGTGMDVAFRDHRTTRIASYRRMHQLLKSREMIHIAMQYPTLDVEVLKNYFKTDPAQAEVDPEFSDILFVENKRNFSAELAKRPYEELFRDRTASVIGHTTHLGNSLIAEAALSAVLRVIQRR